ncbi:SPASM domain-containing protein [Tissierella sp. MSJ-40]|uniref:SPASM domain-containing protein n=1 Tax=Tissierella simiarum TaxID=2841534 RepID=A0ABS6E375_9FIRM|nr:radical SAM/SPASM domain-containing protein [Tissierella simiarum]MBU5437354.1 SPASM domain-containing protein [Tissierella simiarum]
MKKFKKVYIEITNVCNLQCDFCPQIMREPNFMGIEEFTHILSEIKGFTDYIYFHIKGEPLLHPDIDKFLDISYEKGFKVNITTNGTLIDKVKDKLMGKPALRQINFSLHSFDGNTKLTNKEDYLKEIFNFIKETRDEESLIIALRLWNLDEDNIINKEAKRNKEIIEKIEEEFNLPFKIQEEITPQRGIKIGDRLYLNQDSRFQWPDLDAEELNDVGFCYGLRDQIGILSDGTVIPCCLDGEGVINLGNIFETSFSEIIMGDRAKKIYEGFSNRKVVEELCRKCGYRVKFNS